MKIKNKLIDNEIYEKVKDYSKEKNRVRTYFEVGKLLSDAGSYYGKDVVGDYSKKLADEVNRKYNRRTLFRMKQVYNTFNNEKVSALLTQLSWSHCLEEDETIGIIICRKDNKFVMEYCSDDRIFRTIYLLN